MNIIQKGNEILRKKAKDVPLSDIGSEKINNILEKMEEVMKESTNGVAIAAPQIGESWRIFMIDKMAITGESENQKDENPLIFINPKITKISKKKIPLEEGCLSVEGTYGVVERADKLTVEALDENGNKISYNASKFLAQVIQHEMDHLEGILFVDKAKKIKKEEVV